MLPQTRSGRRFLSGAMLIAATAAVGFGARGSATPYTPDAPAYRQKGPADAPVVITEFSDFQCGGCRAAVAPVKRLAEKLFKGKIRVIYKHHPWDFHRWAKDAAVAAECAGKAGDFWGYHDEVFDHQREWAVLRDPKQFREELLSYARKLKLDEAAFTACLNDPAVAQAVTDDLKEAGERWVNTTPTFFINGTRFVGSQQLRTKGLNLIEDILKE